MTQYYFVRHDSSRTPDCPWVQKIVNRPKRGEACSECGVQRQLWKGDLDVLLDPDQGAQWPDVLGCGAHALLVVSESVVQAWQAERIGDFPRFLIRIQKPYPAKLAGTPPPTYYWLDGSQMLGAKLDFESSGFVGVYFCDECGTRRHDIRATRRQRQSGQWPYAFVEGTMTDVHLFTTDLSSSAFFCTDAVVECARKHQLTNFRFNPVEEGDAIGREGVRYLG